MKNFVEITKNIYKEFVISHSMDKTYVEFMFRAVCESSHLRVCYVYSEYLDVCC